MDDLAGQVLFPGVEQIVEARCVFGHGIAPGIMTIDIAPQSTPVPSSGSLELRFGAARIAWADCRVEGLSFRFTEQGAIWRLTILDRRWRWAFGGLSGSYNLRRDNGEVISTTQRSVLQLAELCLAAMGEASGDLSDLPTGVWPTVEWDYVNPATALAALAKLVGCRVILCLDNRVALRRVGRGELLPRSNTLMSNSSTGISAPAPTSLCMVTGRVRFQADFQLQAVGLDVDGEIRPVDQLSYRPEAGWSSIDIEHFQSISNLKMRELAKATVFRWYQVQIPFELPLYGMVEDLNRVLPLENEQVVLSQREDGTTRNRPALVFGVWADYAHQASNRVEFLRPLPIDFSGDDPRSIVPYKFTIDRDRALVKFSQPVIRYDSTAIPGTVLPAAAHLVLRTAVSVRDPAAQIWKRLERRRVLSSSGNENTLFIKRGELLPCVLPEYDPGSYALIGSTTNFAEITAQADALLDILQPQFGLHQPERAIYAGLEPIQPDGSVDLVIWSIGPAGTTTEAIREHRHHGAVARSTGSSASMSGASAVSIALDSQQARRDTRHQPVT